MLYPRPFKKLLIEFDLKVITTEKGFVRTDVLLFENDRVRMRMYLNGWGEFGIKHHDAERSNFELDTLLFRINLIQAPLSPIQGFNHFVILILDKERITVEIDGAAFDQQIDIKLLPQNAAFHVWIDREGMRADGAIKNLMIKSM